MESYSLCAFALLQRIRHNDFWSQHFLIAGLLLTPPVQGSAKIQCLWLDWPGKRHLQGEAWGMWLLSGTVELLALWQRPRAGKIVFIVLGELFDWLLKLAICVKHLSAFLSMITVISLNKEGKLQHLQSKHPQPLQFPLKASLVIFLTLSAITLAKRSNEPGIYV